MEFTPAPRQARRHPTWFPVAKSGKAPKAAGPSDEMKAKFREALERKQAHAGRESAGEGEGKVHDAHGPAAAQRMFRRKSGG